MDFYKLTDFQLYSIINSRHLDSENKEQAERELQRRNLPETKLRELAAELADKTKAAPPVFNLSSNVLLLLGVLVLLFLLRQVFFK